MSFERKRAPPSGRHGVLFNISTVSLLYLSFPLAAESTLTTRHGNSSAGAFIHFNKRKVFITNVSLPADQEGLADDVF